MTISKKGVGQMVNHTLEDKDNLSFVAEGLGYKRKVTGSVSIEGMLAGVSWDWFTRTLTTATKETYQFYTGGSSGTLVATIELNYSDSTLASLTNGGRV
jgi:hypothetical protein